jgi:hypothetical protein
MIINLWNHAYVKENASLRIPALELVVHVERLKVDKCHQEVLLMISSIGIERTTGNQKCFSSKNKSLSCIFNKNLMRQINH